MTNEEIAKSIKWHRENREINGKDVAGILNLSPASYSRMENGERAITAVELVLLSKLYEITIDDLIIIPSRRKYNN